MLCILTNVWGAQHPIAGRNIQQLVFPNLLKFGEYCSELGFFSLNEVHFSNSFYMIISERDSLTVTAFAWHAADPGSNPGEAKMN